LIDRDYAIKITTKVTDSGRNIEPQSKIERLLRKYLPYKEIGWQDIGEVFYRYTILKTPWFNLYLHQLDAPEWHPVGCHDHPWWFITVLLKGGYLEMQRPKSTRGFPGVGEKGGLLKRRYPGMILFRPANHTHDVVTPYGRSWSLVLTGRKSRDWGFLKCGG
jgi:hypothetical protein